MKGKVLKAQAHRAGAPSRAHPAVTGGVFSNVDQGCMVPGPFPILPHLPGEPFQKTGRQLQEQSTSLCPTGLSAVLTGSPDTKILAEHMHLVNSPATATADRGPRKGS